MKKKHTVLFPEKTKILIVDDDLQFIELLKLILQDIGIQHISHSINFKDACHIFQIFSPDLVIIDIELRDLNGNGIELAKFIQKKCYRTPIIFMTSFFTEENYAKCRIVKPSSFMNKELSHFKILQALDIALQGSNKQGTSIGGPHNLASKGVINNKSFNYQVPYIDKKTYFFKVGEKYQSFPIEEILFFYSKDKLTFAKIDNRNYPTNVQLKNLQQGLFPDFLRVHKSFLVQQSKIDLINFKEGKIKIGTEVIPIGLAYKKDFVQKINLLK